MKVIKAKKKQKTGKEKEGGKLDENEDQRQGFREVYSAVQR